MRLLLFSAIGTAAFVSLVSGADQVIATPTRALAVSYTKKGDALLVATADRKVHVWDFAKRTFGRSFEPESDDRRSVLLAAAGQFAFTSTKGGVRVGDIASGAVLANFTVPAARSRIGSLESSVDGAWLAISAGDPASPSAHAIRVVDRAGKTRFHTLAGVGSVGAMAFSPDGTTFVAAGFDTDIRVWDVRTGKLRHTVEEMPLAMFDMDFSPDGKYLATAGADQIIYLWDAKSWKVVRTIKGQPETIAKLRFSPDGTKVATGGMSALNFADPVKVMLWEVSSGRALKTWEAKHRVQGLAFSPDGAHLAVADGSTEVTLWAVPKGR